MTPDDATLQQLASRVNAPGAAVVRGEGGLACVDVRTSVASARVYLHGAHVTHYQPAGARDVLWLSNKSHYQAGKAIRGGVPVIFPWFGPKAGSADAPQHGLVRTGGWALESVEAEANGATVVTLSLASHASTRMVWPHEFELRYRVTVGSELAMALHVRNTGPTPFTFEEALHTYLSIGDVRQTRVEGLEGVEYVDKTQAMRRFRQSGPITFEGETDRVYVGAEHAAIVRDPVLGRSIVVEKIRSRSTVVWNPWDAKASSMADFATGQWPAMLCIESGNIADDAITLSAGETHEMTARIRVETFGAVKDDNRH